MLDRSPESRPVSTRHAIATRYAHFGLAICVIVQLLTSLVMEGPHRGRPGDAIFTVHEVSGLSALVCAFAFWCIVALRRRGTSVALLFPWLSARRIADVWRDGWAQVAAVLRARLPRYEEEAPLASAVHGLGLLLISTMAVTGAIWFFANLAALPPSTPLRLDMAVHHLLANLVWAYLIGHALLGLVHHVAGESSLATMWSLKRAER